MKVLFKKLLDIITT